MRALVVYDSVSPAKVTAKVAEAVAAGMKEGGATVDLLFVEEAGKADLSAYDVVVVGAPTMAWKPSTRMKEFLAGLKGSNFAGKMAASFDTQMKSVISGDATKHMDKSLTDLGFRIVSPSLLAYVKSKDKVYQLNEGELDKAKAWGRELAKKASK